uniref:zona pellucida sperm-binding protein 2-like n=1 Tax=Solea senegalensis TaxID=28829 RepID=UPI001CD862E8|nr:zona pellucida sperm-binding protein 2-like [Solea senegalensis]
MASTTMLLLQLVLVSLASASHHYGGMATYTYKGRNTDGSFNVDFRRRSTYSGCFSHHSWNCVLSGHCAPFTYEKGTIESNSIWCETELLSRIKVVNDKPFNMRAHSCCWVNTRNLVSNWYLLTLIDLGMRSDTREPNRSPDVSIVPYLRIPKNCPRTYKLMAFDPDGDRVRCRYGNLPALECHQCSLPGGFTLDQDSCMLHYNSTTHHSSVFGFEMVVEDFPKNHISLTYSDRSRRSVTPLNLIHPAPLSKLPLQFSVLVENSAPSCQEGVYLPQFVNPTPANGARVQAVLNKEMEIIVKAQVSMGSIQAIHVSGPMNISKHTNAHNEFVIKWTPLHNNLGDHYPICFVVDALHQSRVYQSEMRCVLVDITETQVESHVICTETTMTVMVEKASFPRLHQDHLRLSDPTNTVCSLQTHSNSTHVIGVFPLNACGTQIEEDNDFLYFKNEITPFDNSADVITRKHQLEVQFYCQYPKRGNVTQGFLAHRTNVTVWDKGFGTFTYQFEFYPDNQFNAMIDPISYPLEYDLGSRIYMQIEATSSVSNTELFVESCKASPYDNPNYSQTYSIIENGCKVDPTVVIHPSTDVKEFKFSIEAFKFIGLHDQVYISCSLMMCEAGNSNTRCSQGCINSTSPAKRRKRGAIIQSAHHFVSQGPLRLHRSAESHKATGTWNLNLNLVFIVGCLLAAVGMVCGVALYKAKMSKVKYQPLPHLEN